MADVLVLGIAGGTGSGKTTLAHALAERFPRELTIISQDSYYRAHHDMGPNERTKLNYDHPDAFEDELLCKQLEELKAGHAIEEPIYDFAAHDRTDRTRTVSPSPVIVVEGILAFWSKELRDLLDIKVFVDTDADVRILRRIQRDVEERGRSLSSVADQYLTTVKPMHEAFVEPQRRYADMIIPGDGAHVVALDMLESHIRACLRKDRR